jgi:hypothetical protein
MLPQNEKGFFPNEIWILLKDVEVAFKLKRYIFKLHLSGFQLVMHLKFCFFFQLEVLCFIWAQALVSCFVAFSLCCICDVCG